MFVRRWACLPLACNPNPPQGPVRATHHQCDGPEVTGETLLQTFGVYGPINLFLSPLEIALLLKHHCQCAMRFVPVRSKANGFAGGYVRFFQEVGIEQK